MSRRGAVGRAVERHPRLWGALFAVLLLVGYAAALRPARVWLAEAVALPLFAAVDTPRARTFHVVEAPGQATDVLAVPAGAMPEAARAAGTTRWAAPGGVLFLLPGMFLLAVFPARPYWLYLLAYHVALGALALGAFVVGLGWFEPAFAVYTFARTYLAETVSLAVPLLLWLAGRAEPPQAPASTAA